VNTDLFSLAGRTALVTGGNGGLGRAMALGLRAAGARVVVTGRSDDKNVDMARELHDGGAVVRLDVRDEVEVERTVEYVIERFGRLDILINNAGLAHGRSVLELTRDEWEAVVDTNLTGSFLCAKRAAQAMVTRRAGGKIINIGSMYSIFGQRGGAAYAASKTAILGLTRSLAVELAIYDIQVNAILPGWYDTAMTAGTPATPVGNEIRRRTPAGRWGKPDDIVGAAVFLASAASDYVTGAAIPVDGGYAVADQLLHE